MKSLKWTRAGLWIPVLRFAVGCLVALASCLESSASDWETNLWYGCGTNGNWSTRGNWLGSDLPTDYDYRSWIRFMPTGCQKSTTNDLRHEFHAISIEAGSYQIYGNSVYLDGRITADYAAGGTSTVHMDIVADKSGSYVYDTFFESINVINNNSTLQIIGDVVMNNSLLGIDFTGAGDLSISGVIGGAGDLRKSSTGDLTLLGSSANTFTGAVYVTAGTLRLNKTAFVPPGITVGRVSVPGDLVIGSGTSGLISDIVWLGYHNQIADTSAVRIYASGQLDLNGYNDTIGSLEMIGGSIVTGTGTLTLNGNVTCLPAAYATSISGKLALGSAQSRQFQVGPAAQMEVNAAVSGGPGTSLTKGGPGELILAGANTYEGLTLVYDGTLTVMHPQALGSNTNGTTLEDATLKLDNAAIASEPLTVMRGRLEADGAACAWNGDIVLWTNLPIQVNASSALVFSNTISKSGGLIFCILIKEGPGQLTLKGQSANTQIATIMYEGELVLSKTPGQNSAGNFLWVYSQSGNSIARWAAADQIADTGDLYVAGPSVLDLNSFSETVDHLGGDGKVLLGTGRLTVSNAVGNYTFSGVITGSTGGLTKSGAGTMTLSGTNKYSGTTAISNGTLCVNGVISNSPISLVATGSVLSGTGRVQSISVAKGTVSPGSSTGILTSLGAATLAPGTLAIELNGTNVGTDYDQLRALGVVTLDKATLDVTCGFAPVVGATFKIIDNASTKAVDGTFNGLPEGKVFGASGAPFQISYAGGDGNDVVLTRVQSPAVTNLVAQLTNNQVRVRAQGIAGANYVIEAAPNLNVPVAWAPISTNAASGSGLIEFIEPDISLYAQRFYRLASP